MGRERRFDSAFMRRALAALRGQALGAACLAAAYSQAGCEEKQASTAPLDSPRDNGGDNEEDDGGAAQEGGMEQSEYLGALDPGIVHHVGKIAFGSGMGEVAIGRWDKVMQAWWPFPPRTTFYGLRGLDGNPVYVSTSEDNLKSTLRFSSLVRPPATAEDMPPTVKDSTIEANCDRIAVVKTVPESNSVVYGCQKDDRDQGFDACREHGCDYFTDDGEPFAVPAAYALAHVGLEGHLLVAHESKNIDCNGAVCKRGFAVVDAEGKLTPLSGVASDPDAFPIEYDQAFASQADDDTLSVRALSDGFWMAHQTLDGDWARWHVGFDGKVTLEGTYKAIRKRPMGSLALTFDGWCALDVDGDLYCVGSFLCCDGQTTQSESIIRLSLEKEGVVVHEEGSSPEVYGSDESFPIPRVQLGSGSALLTGP